MAQGVAPPVHVYEKPAGSSSSSSSSYTPAQAKSDSDAKIELEGWKAAGAVPGAAPQRSHLQRHNHRAQAKVDILTHDDLSTSADSSGNWLTKSVSVGKSITAGKPRSSTAAKRGEPKAEARIDTGDSPLASSTAVALGAKVSVAGAEVKEKLRKGTVEDIKNE